MWSKLQATSWQGLSRQNCISFACCISSKSIQILAMVNELGSEVHQLDVSCAFLNTYLEPDIKLYLVSPEGMKLPPEHSLLGCKALWFSSDRQLMGHAQTNDTETPKI